MREVEVLVQVHDDFKKARNFLERSAKFNRTLRIRDIYFFDPQRSNLSPNNQGELAEALRVRKTNQEAVLTHKVDHFDARGNWTHSDEQEVEIASAQKMITLLKCLGFQELVTVDMEKLYFETLKYDITLEQVRDLGLFLEVEAHPAEDREVSVVRAEIKKFIQSLGFNTSEDVGIGKPELLLRKRRRSQG